MCAVTSRFLSIYFMGTSVIPLNCFGVSVSTSMKYSWKPCVLSKSLLKHLVPTLCKPWFSPMALQFIIWVISFHNFHILLLHSRGSFNFKRVDTFPFVAQYGNLPIELAAKRDCMEEVEMLFPLTSPIPSIPNWSIDGIISYEKFESAKPLVHYLLLSPCRWILLECLVIHFVRQSWICPSTRSSHLKIVSWLFYGVFFRASPRQNNKIEVVKALENKLPILNWKGQTGTPYLLSDVHWLKKAWLFSIDPMNCCKLFVMAAFKIQKCFTSIMLVHSSKHGSFIVDLKLWTVKYTHVYAVLVTYSNNLTY